MYFQLKSQHPRLISHLWLVRSPPATLATALNPSIDLLKLKPFSSSLTTSLNTTTNTLLTKIIKLYVWLIYLFLWELWAGEGLAEGPIWGSNIVRDNCASVAGGHLKRQALSIKVIVALPVLTPVPRHGFPTTSWPFDRSTDGNAMKIMEMLDFAGCKEIWPFSLRLVLWLVRWHKDVSVDFVCCICLHAQCPHPMTCDQSQILKSSSHPLSFFTLDS